MKHIIFLFTIFSFTVLHAQYHKGTVYFKDGKTAEGLIRVKSNGIKFKPAENAEIIEYNHEQIKGYDVKGWQFRYVFDKSNNKPPELLKLILEGKVSLYSTMEFNVGSVNNMNSIGFPIGSSHYTVYYITKNNELMVIGSKFKKKSIETFNDCPELIEKIKRKEFKKWDVYDIVEFYNEECNQD